MDFFAPVRITGTRVALEPLSMRHVDDLAVAGADEAIWRWLPTAHYQPELDAGFCRIRIGGARAARGVAFRDYRSAVWNGRWLNTLPPYRH